MPVRPKLSTRTKSFDREQQVHAFDNIHELGISGVDKIAYDSDASSDDELSTVPPVDMAKVLRDARLIDPLSRFRKVWDLLQVILLVHVATMTP
eukprot:SAG11_NODE_8843_length_970_cov_1.409874_1_plen_93_part_01